MPSLMDFISQHVGQEQIKQIASKIGASPEQTQAAVSIALPTLLGAVSRKAENEEGAKELHQQLQNQDNGMLDQLSGLLGGASGGPGAIGGLLEGLLGGRQARVEQGISKASGLNVGQMSSLLSMLAPIVMGALGRQQKSENMDAGALAGALRKEKESMETQASGGLLAGLLDQDGDGDFDMTDIMKLGMKKLFGSK
jgi:hypothetical protein